jgi:hypothetical protein
VSINLEVSKLKHEINLENIHLDKHAYEDYLYGKKGKLAREQRAKKKAIALQKYKEKKEYKRKKYQELLSEEFIEQLVRDNERIKNEELERKNKKDDEDTDTKDTIVI